jgi:hypothetical protein
MAGVSLDAVHQFGDSGAWTLKNLREKLMGSDQGARDVET